MKNSFLENLNQGVLGLKPYEPGLPLEHTQKKLGLEKMIKLASNENPMGPVSYTHLTLPTTIEV